jgi:hypothetical protein
MTPEELKEYHRRKSKEWRRNPANMQRLKEYVKEWRLRNKARIKEYAKRYYRYQNNENKNKKS